MGRRGGLVSAHALLLAALPLATALATPPPNCSPSQSDRVHHWTADGNAEDSAGTADGTVSGATYVAGRFGSAFSFDGVDDQISFGDTAGNFGTADFTVAFWIRTTATALMGVLGKRTTCTHSSFFDIRLGDDGRFGVELDQDGSGSNYNGLNTTATVNDGGFHHFAFVREGPALRLYVDGVADTSASTAGVTAISNMANLVAGRSACTDGVDDTEWLDGQLDDIRIYDRALSLCEILLDVESGLDVDLDGEVGALTDALLVLRWLFGFRGATLVTGATGADCVRCGTEAIGAYIETLEGTDLLDVDDSGGTGPLTDGLLLLRYAFGFRGTVLTAGTVDTVNCMRCDSTAIETYLDPLFP
jgi:hypothetical protein